MKISVPVHTSNIHFMNTDLPHFTENKVFGLCSSDIMLTKSIPFYLWDEIIVLSFFWQFTTSSSLYQTALEATKYMMAQKADNKWQDKYYCMTNTYCYGLWAEKYFQRHTRQIIPLWVWSMCFITYCLVMSYRTI